MEIEKLLARGIPREAIGKFYGSGAGEAQSSSAFRTMASVICRQEVVTMLEPEEITPATWQRIDEGVCILDLSVLSLELHLTETKNGGQFWELWVAVTLENSEFRAKVRNFSKRKSIKEIQATAKELVQEQLLDDLARLGSTFV